MNFFEIYRETNQDDGYGSLAPTGIRFFTYDEALKFTKSEYMSSYTVMGITDSLKGFSYLIKEVKSKEIFKTFEDWLVSNKKARIDNVINKLSLQELEDIKNYFKHSIIEGKHE